MKTCQNQTCSHVPPLKGPLLKCQHSILQQVWSVPAEAAADLYQVDTQGTITRPSAQGMLRLCGLQPRAALGGTGELTTSQGREVHSNSEYSEQSHFATAKLKAINIEVRNSLGKTLKS